MKVATTSPYGSPIPLLCATGGAGAEEDEEATNISESHQFPPPIPLTLSFSNLTYSIKLARCRYYCLCAKEQETKILLDDISGEAHEGEILAVLGPSGSGKTTLIDALANRIVKGRLKGTTNIDGQPLDSRRHQAISAYVMQDDLLFPMLTVEETLTFAAELRLPRTLSKSKKRKRVLDLIDQLDLKNAAQTVIGDEGHRGVSGGERRRVSIGIEIITDPILLFLDEPTTGLDSTSSFAVVKVLQRIAKRGGSIVIMSIHQPSYRVLGLLNRLIFLSRGQVVFSGCPSSLPSYLSAFGHPIPEDQNPSEAALDLICDLQENSSGTTSENGTKRLVEFHKSWQNNMVPPPPPPRIFMHGSTISPGKLLPSKLASNNNNNPFWKEVLVLLNRSFLNSRRSPEILINRFGVTLVTAVIFASTYWKLDFSPKENEEKRLLLGLTAATVFFICGEGWGNFLRERNIVLRETSFNSYRKISYILAHALSWLPSMLFLSIVLSVILFWGVGLHGGFNGFLFYWGVIFASFWAGNSFITLIVEFVPQVLVGFCVMLATLTCFVFFSGLYITRDRIPSYWTWFHYLSLIKYPFQAMLQNEYGDPSRQNDCVVRAIQSLESTPLLASASVEMKEKFLKSMGEMVGMNITGSTCSVTGEELLKVMGITDLSKWESLGITIAWGFLFRVLYYLALLGRGNTHKRS